MGHHLTSKTHFLKATNFLWTFFARGTHLDFRPTHFPLFHRFFLSFFFPSHVTKENSAKIMLRHTWHNNNSKESTFSDNKSRVFLIALECSRTKKAAHWHQTGANKLKQKRNKKNVREGSLERSFCSSERHAFTKQLCHEAHCRHTHRQRHSGGVTLETSRRHFGMRLQQLENVHCRGKRHG
jgi:hypothetical protein